MFVTTTFSTLNLAGIACGFFLVSLDNQTSNHHFFQMVVRWYIWACDSCKNRPAVYLWLLSEMCASVTCISYGLKRSKF